MGITGCTPIWLPLYDEAAADILDLNRFRYGGIRPGDEGVVAGSLVIPSAIVAGTDAPLPEDMARLIRSAPTQVNAPETLPVLPSQLNSIYLYVGAAERIMEAPERAFEAGTISSSGLRTLWNPLSAPVRQTDRFKAYIRNVGLDNFWRERGFADVCRPVGDDDFECD